MGEPKRFLGESPGFQSVIRSAALVAPTDATVLINGESGTGKELLSHYIFNNSRRNRSPWVTINCAALPESLAESELFGHARGAFTGATQNKKGLVQAADGGTLFLDEISELPLSIQPKLLRLLESGDCQGVGHTQNSQVDIRVIAATNKHLPAMVQKGEFREDLFYRLNLVPLDLPALRDRHEDIMLLSMAFFTEIAEKYRLAPACIAPETEKVLKNYRWPGNIRELRNFCERMSILHAGKSIQSTDLPVDMVEDGVDSQLRSGADSRFILPEGGMDFMEMEQNLIGQALQRAQGNKSRAASLLGFTRDTFLYRLKKFSIPV